MREVDLSNLLKKGSQIDWKNSIGKTISFIYDDICGDFEICEHSHNKTSKVVVKYLGKCKTITIPDLKRGRLGGVLDKITTDYKCNVGDEIKDEKRNLIILDRQVHKDKKQKNRKMYKCKCNNCGYNDVWIEESNLLKGRGCGCCANRITVVGINDIPTTDTWMVEYFQGGYEEAKNFTRNTHEKFIPICPDCKKIKSKPMNICELYQSHSIGCGCSDGVSYPEKFMMSVLNQLNLNFEWHYTPDWLKGYKGGKKAKEFDFYLPEYSLILEMDGGLGHGKYVHPKRKTSIEETKAIDNWKDAQAAKQGLKVIRIEADESTVEYLKKNIEQHLISIFNLNNVDWNLCDEQATKNKIKEVCEYFEKNKPIVPFDIAIHFKIARTTVNRYLNKGTKIGWCNYDPIENLQNNSKTVDIYKDNVFVGRYDSPTQLSKNSIKHFGIELYQPSISAAALGKTKHHKGYTFKYV